MQLPYSVNYTITVTNNGTIPATGVVVTDPLPSEVQFNSASTSQGSFVANGQTVTFNIGTVNPGQTVILKISATILKSVKMPGDVVNTAYEFYNEGPARTTSTPFGSRSSSSTFRIIKGSLPATGEHPAEPNLSGLIFLSLGATLILVISAIGITRRVHQRR